MDSNTSLSSALNQRATRPRQHRAPAGSCAVTELLKKLSASDAKALRKSLADNSRRDTEIAEALALAGIVMSWQTVRRHRIQACGCYRNAVAR